MQAEIIKKFQGKRIKLVLKNSYVYNCTILEFLEDAIRIEDKFGFEIIVSTDNIAQIQELEQ